jgi:hypothetical protein
MIERNKEMYPDRRVARLLIKPTPTIKTSVFLRLELSEVPTGTLNKDANGQPIKRKAVRFRYAGG